MRGEYAGISRKNRRKTTAIIAVIIALAMLVSFTMAWFMQTLQSKDNILQTGKVQGKVELWVQTSDANGGFREKLSDADFAAAVNNTVADTSGSAVTAIPTPAPGKNYADDTLYRLDGGAALTPDQELTNKLLNDVVEPGETIRRRLIVRNPIDNMTVAFRAEFPHPAGTTYDPTTDFDLAEAIQVKTTNVTNLAYTPVVSMSNISGDALYKEKRIITGEVAPASYSAYEMSFRYVSTASIGYSQKQYSLDVSLKAYGAFANSHYVGTADELAALLRSSDLHNGDSIILSDNISMEDFVTNKVFNLDLNGYTLSVTNFAVNFPKDENDTTQDAMLTMDVGAGANGTANDSTAYGTGCLKISGKVAINAPKTAVRWMSGDGKYTPYTNSNGETSAMPRNKTAVEAGGVAPYEYQLNVRSFNGERGEEVAQTVAELPAPSILSAERDYATEDADTGIPLEPMGGIGTYYDPYTISTLGQYKTFEHSVNAVLNGSLTASETLATGTKKTYEGQYVKLMNDLDFLGVSNVPQIGNLVENLIAKTGNYFGGTFEGNYCSIHNLQISLADTTGIGMFGYVHGGIIQNLRRIGGQNVGQNSAVGGIVGKMYDSSIINCVNTSDCTAGGDVGGIVSGAFWDSTVQGCYNGGTIKSTVDKKDAGGVVAYVQGYNLTTEHTALIADCYNTGTVIGMGAVGGLLANTASLQSSKLTIRNCFNAGNIITSATSAGGIMGQTGSSVIKELNISSCYNAGQVNGPAGQTAGIVAGIGINYSNPEVAGAYATVHIGNCYSAAGLVSGDITLRGSSEVPASDAQKGLMTEADMKKADFVKTLNGGAMTGPFKMAREGYYYKYPWLDWEMGMYHVGDSIGFGGRTWLVVDRDGASGNMTLLYHDAENIIAPQQMDAATNDWSKSAMRTWLNGGFKDGLPLIQSEKDAIVTVNNEGSYNSADSGATYQKYDNSADEFWLPGQTQITGYDPYDRIQVADGIYYYNPPANMKFISIKGVPVAIPNEDKEYYYDATGGEQWQYFQGKDMRFVSETFKPVSTTGNDYVWTRTSGKLFADTFRLICYNGWTLGMPSTDLFSVFPAVTIKP